MADKVKTVFVCRECGYEHAKWMGKCPSCDSWNTMEAEARRPAPKRAPAARAVVRERAPVSEGVTPLSINDMAVTDEQRYPTGMGEFDRVLGGGLVRGSVVLIGGDPGIGKSTLLLQVSGALSKGLSVLYISGEESKNQIKLRAGRLGVSSDRLFILSETSIDEILGVIERDAPDIAVVDSIQTVYNDTINSIPGSVTQIKDCAQQLMQAAKRSGVSTFLVGHVNKEGAIAGPKVLEHMVDAVLYFEGDRNFSHRVMRAAKNRYGSTSEIGMFAMEDDGLHEVKNPSAMLLEGRPLGVSGSCIVSMMEGSRPIMAEVQALIAPVGFGNPRRTINGVDYNRAAMLLAVLEKRAGYRLSSCDVFINVIGGLRISEPSADLAILMAVASSYKDKPVCETLIAVGEVGLSGEIRAARAIEGRLIEAARMGFTKALLPKMGAPKRPVPGIELIRAGSVVQAISLALND